VGAGLGIAVGGADGLGRGLGQYGSFQCGGWLGVAAVTGLLGGVGAGLPGGVGAGLPGLLGGVGTGLPGGVGAGRAVGGLLGRGRGLPGRGCGLPGLHGTAVGAGWGVAGAAVGGTGLADVATWPPWADTGFISVELGGADAQMTAASAPVPPMPATARATVRVRPFSIMSLLRGKILTPLLTPGPRLPVVMPRKISQRTAASASGRIPASARNARPRWLIASFSSAVSSAEVRASPSGWKIGS
jgi:hypothetical protein